MTCGVHRFCAVEAPERCPWCEVSKLTAEVARLRTEIQGIAAAARMHDDHGIEHLATLALKKVAD